MADWQGKVTRFVAFPGLNQPIELDENAKQAVSAAINETAQAATEANLK